MSISGTISLGERVEKNTCVKKQWSGEKLGVNVQIHMGWRVRGTSDHQGRGCQCKQLRTVSACESSGKAGCVCKS